jgi:hypothetical protein
MHLIVVEPFGPYRKGDLITDGVEAVLREHAGSVVSPEQPKAEEVPEVPASPPQPEKPAEEPKDAQ